jgi:hypothetical protein
MWRPPSNPSSGGPSLAFSPGMKRMLLLVTLVTSACAAPIATGPSPARDAEPKERETQLVDRRFYTGLTYGSEAQFNPITELLNEGFDVLSMSGQDRQILRRDLGGDASTVWSSVLHADRTFADYGWQRALRRELIPKGQTSAWISNYQLHLFGSGMVSRRLAEWYDDHGVPHPELLGALSVMPAHFMNEMVENNGQRQANEDAAADLLFFDLAGIALWRMGWMQRTFSETFQLTNWPGQATWNPATQTLENTGQYFSLRGPLPFTRSVRAFYLFGESAVIGLSRKVGETDALSLGAGMDADSTGRRPKAGLYYDRNGSLLWSVAVGSPTTAVSWLTVNAYPGALRVKGVSPGLWFQLPKNGGARFGIVSSWGLGIGGGSGR